VLQIAGGEKASVAHLSRAALLALLELIKAFDLFTRPGCFAQKDQTRSGLKKNTAQLITLFALANLWLVRGKLMHAQG
jgi:hypothetical protein